MTDRTNREPSMTAPTPVEVIAYAQDSEIVYLDWPDGAETLVKGRDLLSEIIKTNQSQNVRISRIPVGCTAEAEVIAAAISLMEAGDFHLGAEAAFCKMLERARAE